MNNYDAESEVKELTDEFAIGHAVAFAISPLGGVVAMLASAGGKAAVALRGGQVIGWQPEGSSEVLWCNPGGRLDSPRPLRGGIPVCWPWFGLHPTDASKPAHGFARTTMWRVTGTAAAGCIVRLRLALVLGEAELVLWPEAGSAELEVTVGRELKVTLVTRNLGSAPLIVSAALHTYLGIGDIGDVRIAGLEGVTFIDRLDRDRRSVQVGPISFSGEVERVYLDQGGDLVLSDAQFDRCIRVGREGSRSVVVWTPWRDKVEKLVDVKGDDWRRILCIEAANVADDTVTIRPGAEHRLSTTLSLEQRDAPLNATI